MKPSPSMVAGRIVIALCLLAPIGCVERRMTIRSVPTNALVVLDGQEIGHTPVSTRFEYYGDREIRLIKDGFETKTIRQRVSAPWYQYPPIDFFSEVFWPVNIRDERNYVYGLEPAMLAPTDRLLERAEATRIDGREPPPEALRRVGAVSNETIVE